MADNCTSDPTSGCGDNGALVAALTTSNTNITSRLDDINDKLATLVDNTAACCEDSNALMVSMNDKLTTLINNSATYYNSLLGRLDTITGLLEISAGVPDVPFKSFNISFASHVCVEVP